MDLGFDTIEALKELVGANDDENEHVYGSAINPGTLGGGGKKDPKELAKPNTKVEVKTFNRDARGGATEESLKKAAEEKKTRDTKNDIWTEEEVNIKAEELPDDRPQPQFDVLYKQNVGTEDVFLGLSDKDPSSLHCDSILIKIWLPGAKLSQIQLDIQKQMIYVQSPTHVLKHFLPYPVDKEKGKAQFDSDKGLLSVTSNMNKQTIEELIQFCEQRNLKDLASGLQKDLKALTQTSQAQKDPQSNKENQERALMIIRKAIKLDDMKKLKEDAKDSLPLKPFQTQKQNFSFNKEETEETMEKLMNRIVGKPNLIADDKLNAKIEKIFNVEAFQKMVENADIFQDLSSSSLFNQSEFLQRSANANLSFKKVLPTHSQMQEDDEEELPRFGQQPVDSIHQDIDDSVRDIFGPEVRGNDDRQTTFHINDDSFTQPITGPKDLSSKDPFKAGKISNVGKDRNQKPSQQPNKRRSKGPYAGEDNYEDDIMQRDSGKQLSMIQHAENDASFFQNSESFVFANQEIQSMNKEGIDDYADDEDPGFEIYVVNEENFVASCKELSEINNFPARAIKPDNKEQQAQREKYKKQQQELHAVKKDDSAVMLQKLQKKDLMKAPINLDDDELAGASAQNEEHMEDEEDEDGRQASVLPKWIKFMPSNDEFYPAEFDSVIYDCYSLRVVFDREKTGFEESKDFPIVIGAIIAGRYQVVEYLGSAAFSKAIQCYDIHTEQMVCMKIIENNKDYFDQSIDEIKLLRYIQANCDNLDEKNLLKLFDFFYHKEHLFIVTELLRDNLYEYSKYNREVEKGQPYFTISRLQRITKQILTALDFIHNLRLIHCDLKPENILIKSYSRCEVKVIDFGSSCFIHDHLSSYVQSRSYRAPEVILGCRYDYKIDMWSLGCILAELYTGYVLFQNDSVQGLLARVLGIIGPVPEYMMKEGRLVSSFFTREGLIYQEGGADDEAESQNLSDSGRVGAGHKKPRRGEDGDLKIHILVPKKTTLKHRLKCEDPYFIDFVRWLLEVDPTKRPSAKEAMQHPWLTECVYQD